MTIEETPGTALANLEAELANEVALLRNAISQPTGTRLKVEPNGDFVLPDGTNLGPEINVVVVDFATHHDYYDQMYNPNNPAPPVCYARGRDIKAMVPGDDSPEKQADACAKCPWDKFGTGINGTSKACKNSRVVALRIEDPENPEALGDAAGDVYFFAVSPASITNFDKAMGGVARTLGHPVKAKFTMVAKNAGTYAKVNWIDPVPNPYYAVHYAQKADVQDQLFRTPDFAAYAERAAAKPANPPRRPGARR